MAPRSIARGLVLALALAAAPVAAVTLPSNFVVENATPSATWSVPVAIQFFPEETPGQPRRMLVAEKAGRVWTVTNGVKAATPLLDLNLEVLDAGDRGLLGIAIDPNYLANRRIYLLYTVDPDSNANETNNDAYARLTRYTVSAANPNAIEAGSRAILIGRNWREGIPSGSSSHTIGTLEFGADGTLFVGAGDGAQFNGVDAGGNDPGLFGATRTDPNEDIGAFRSQMLQSLAGKILRVDPATGLGLPSNPFYVGNATVPEANQSRVWVYGLRNPFRFCRRPGTGVSDPAAGVPGTLYVGDVGWITFEDQHVARTGGLNLGWPCYEGFSANSSYQSASPAHHGCGTIGTPINPSLHSPPFAVSHHSDTSLSVPRGHIGNTNVGGAFYTGVQYPVEYRGAYFYADYGQSWIRVARMDANDQLVSFAPFATAADAPVDITADPFSGDLCYVSISTNQIRRIRWTGPVENQPPIAVASGTPVVGVAPLAVNFSSAGTTDPDGPAPALSWDFGDGSGSIAANPSHVYSAPGAYEAVLTADDGQAAARDTVRVFVNAAGSFPTTGVLDGFNRANGALGGAWVDDVAGLVVNANQLQQTAPTNSFVLSAPVLGPTQEAYVTLATLGAGPEHNLMLKVQGLSWSAGHIEVRFDAPGGTFTVATYAPSQGWVQRLAPQPIALSSGMQVGARAYGNGVLEVFRNGVLVGTADCSGWPFAAGGGRVGLTLTGASGSRLDDFGGGDAVLDPNSPPIAAVVSPADGSFYVEGETIRLVGGGSDGEDPPAALGHRWEVDLHHNTHVHPVVEQADDDTLEFEAENHDDGTGVWLVARHIVTDTGGLRDTVSIRLNPETNLVPSGLVTVPSTPGTLLDATWRFTLTNTGRMPAPRSRWRIVSGTTLIAEGDTLVPALGSVVVERWAPPALVAGDHAVRVVADTLGAVAETSEADNATMRTVTVVAGLGPDEFPPVFTLGPATSHSGVQADVSWRTNEPASGVVRWGASSALGESLVVAGTDTAHTVRIEGLALGARHWLVVAARDTAGNWATSAADSFDTAAGPLEAPGAPARLALSAARPNPARGTVTFALELPSAAHHVELVVYDLAGRAVWRGGPRALGAGRHALAWDGLGPGGQAAPPALYLAKVTVDGTVLVRRFARVR